jgi:hypothetical protein
MATLRASRPMAASGQVVRAPKVKPLRNATRLVCRSDNNVSSSSSVAPASEANAPPPPQASSSMSSMDESGQKKRKTKVETTDQMASFLTRCANVDWPTCMHGSSLHGHPCMPQIPTSTIPSAPALSCFASAHRRRFGIAGGLAWVGFLTVGTLGEQIKTRIEVANEEAGARDVSADPCPKHCTQNCSPLQHLFCCCHMPTEHRQACKHTGRPTCHLCAGGEQGGDCPPLGGQVHRLEGGRGVKTHRQLPRCHPLHRARKWRGGGRTSLTSVLRASRPGSCTQLSGHLTPPVPAAVPAHALLPPLSVVRDVTDPRANHATTQ